VGNRQSAISSEHAELREKQSAISSEHVELREKMQRVVLSVTMNVQLPWFPTL
jgi:hypothetical protein